MTNQHHSVPLKFIIRAFLALLALTTLTIIAALIDFSDLNKFLPRGMDVAPINLCLALLIAVIKSGVVIGFFMGLKYDKALNMAIVAANIVFVVSFFLLTLTDTLYRDMLDPDEGKKTEIDSPIYKINEKTVQQED